MLNTQAQNKETLKANALSALKTLHRELPKTRSLVLDLIAEADDAAPFRDWLLKKTNPHSEGKTLRILFDLKQTLLAKSPEERAFLEDLLAKMESFSPTIKRHRRKSQ